MITRETLKRLEFNKILTEVASHVHCHVTRQRIQETVPQTNREQIGIISGRVEEIRRLSAAGVSLRLSTFDDIRPLMDTLRPSGVFLAPQELLLFIPVLAVFRDITRQLAPRSDIPMLSTFENPLKAFPDILEPLSASIDNEGNIMDSASSQLLEIRRAKRTLAARIRKKIEEIVRDNNIEIFLQDDFITQRSGRWVIPVRMDSKGMVKGVVHDVSSSGETAFMEPLEIIPFVNELENLSAEEKAEEIRILKQLSSWIREDAAEIANCFATLVLLDELNSIAVFSDRYNLEKPQLNESGIVKLSEARHPMLLMLQRQGGLSRVEPLDLQLGEQGRVMVITGPNAGGKTIALKTTGVLILMALCGIPVPANGAQTNLPLLDTLLVDIGDDQSIEQSLSTFSAHVARIATILEQAGPRTLALLDELGAGTEPQQGAAIACGVLRELQEQGAAVIATTHLSDIIGFVHKSPGMINAGMEYDSRTYTPLYRLISGEPGHSHAIDIARRFGLPERVIVFAREMIGTAGAEFTSLLAELRRKRVELDDTARSLERQQERINDMQKEVEARSAGIAQAKREASEKAWNEAREVISNTRRRMNELLDELKREKRTETIDKIRKTEAELTIQLKPQLEENNDLLPLKEVKPGDQVHVRSINNNAVVLQVDSKRGKARVRAGSMELDVLISDLAARRKADVKKQPHLPQRQWKVDTVESEERELKLIGLRVEEALDMLEPFLNQASLSNIGEVRIIHGLGSGKLKQAVREYLSHHQLVENFRSGEPHEGRDGATVAKIRF